VVIYRLKKFLKEKDDMEGLIILAIIGFFIWYIYNKNKNKDDESNYNPVYRQSNPQITPATNQRNQGCPKCGSTNLQALNQTVKVQRGAGYQILMGFLFLISFGILWLLFGCIKKKVVQTYIVCLNCGYKRLV